jgi:DNA-binding response OmpR family regulator
VLVLQERDGADLASILEPGRHRPDAPEDHRGAKGGPGVAPDVIVLDLGRTGPEGPATADRSLKSTDAYLVLLNSQDEPDRLIELSAETADSVPGPLSAQELADRVGAVLERHRGRRLADPGPRQLADLTINLASREVHRGEEEIELTRTEFDILVALSGQAGIVLTRHELLKTVWGTDWYGNDHVVDVHMSKLRRKLGDSSGEPRYIRTVRGVGFRTAS